MEDGTPAPGQINLDLAYSRNKSANGIDDVLRRYDKTKRKRRLLKSMGLIAGGALAIVGGVVGFIVVLWHLTRPGRSRGAIYLLALCALVIVSGLGTVVIGIRGAFKLDDDRLHRPGMGNAFG